MNRTESQIRDAGPAFSAVLQKVPLQESPGLPPDWLRVEMLERYQILERVGIPRASRVLEIGSGPHAISTVPLAFVIGPEGSVIASEPSRWARFNEVVVASGLTDRVRPVRCDARHLPFENDSVDISACIHGIRSLGSHANLTAIIREMLRVSRRVALAESLPIATNEAQQAHLAMYNLRHEVFEKTLGRPDDLPYRPLEELVTSVEGAGGSVEMATTLEIDLPHALARFPRALIEEIPDARARASLLRRWDEADSLVQRFGADHPPVGIVTARRS